MKYFVTIGERNVEVEIDGDRVVVDGQPVEASVELIAGTPEVRLKIDGTATRFAIDQRHGSDWRVVDQGAVLDTRVEDERSRHIRELSAAAKPVGGPTVLKAPMPGLVVRITVDTGDPVAAGASLVVLEAMKMENELKAAAPGVVGKVLVAPGQAVEKGQVLLELLPQALSTG
jgi:biotin carboxyl carrier protein